MWVKRKGDSQKESHTQGQVWASLWKLLLLWGCVYLSRRKFTYLPYSSGLRQAPNVWPGAMFIVSAMLWEKTDSLVKFSTTWSWKLHVCFRPLTTHRLSPIDILKNQREDTRIWCLSTLTMAEGFPCRPLQRWGGGRKGGGKGFKTGKNPPSLFCKYVQVHWSPGSPNTVGSDSAPLINNRGIIFLIQYKQSSKMQTNIWFFNVAHVGIQFKNIAKCDLELLVLLLSFPVLKSQECATKSTQMNRESFNVEARQLTRPQAQTHGSKTLPTLCWNFSLKSSNLLDVILAPLSLQNEKIVTYLYC